jgi:hypothetical protein
MLKGVFLVSVKGGRDGPRWLDLPGTQRRCPADEPAIASPQAASAPLAPCVPSDCATTAARAAPCAPRKGVSAM